MSSAPSSSRYTRVWLRPNSPVPTTATRILFDGGQADHRYIKAHILAWLADLNYNQRLSTGDSGGARDGLIGAFHCLHGDASAISDHHGLSDVHACDLPGHAQPICNVMRFVLIRGAPREHTSFGHQRLKEPRRIHQADT